MRAIPFKPAQLTQTFPKNGERKSHEILLCGNTYIMQYQGTKVNSLKRSLAFGTRIFKKAVRFHDKMLKRLHKKTQKTASGQPPRRRLPDHRGDGSMAASSRRTFTWMGMAQASVRQSDTAWVI